MKVRPIRASDIDQTYERFSQTQINLDDTIRLATAKSGFLEYPLTHQDLKTRAQSQFSFLLEDKSRRIICYMIGYPVRDIASFSSGHPDPVHAQLQKMEEDTVYVDHLFLEPGQPLHLVMRLVDTFDHIAQCEKVPEVISAIPYSPWRNRSSERIAVFRGFSRQGFIEEGKIRLALFKKPYYLSRQN